jgi:acid phosphatase type 7
VCVLLLLTGCDRAPEAEVPPPGPVLAIGRATSTVDVVAVGDIACEPGSAATGSACRHADTAALAERLAPDAVLALGDTQYQDATLRDYRTAYDESWGALRSATYPIPGNHEYRTADATGYYRYFEGRQPGPPGYYSLRLGAWRAYLLNSNCDEVDCVAQRAWLDEALATDPSSCALIAIHHPRYSSGRHGAQLFTRPFLRIAHRHRVDVVLSGHDHHYERFRRMDADGRPAERGFFQFVSGAGGRSHHEAGPPTKGSLFSDDQAYGVLNLRLSPGKFRYAFTTIDGRTPDTGTRVCR